MHVADAHVEPARLRLSGRHAVLEVSCPLPGVLRLRHAPVSSEVGFLHPELPAKQSGSVIAEGSHALTVERDGDHVRVTAEGVSLEVDAESGTWRFRDSQGRELARCVDVSGGTQAAYPMFRHRARLTLRAPEGERYLGFGEKVGPLDKRGMHFTFWNTDVVPHHPDTDPLYQSIPFFVGLRDGVAWGFFLDESWRSDEPLHRLHARAVGPRLHQEQRRDVLRHEDVRLQSAPRRVRRQRAARGWQTHRLRAQHLRHGHRGGQAPRLEGAGRVAALVLHQDVPQPQPCPQPGRGQQRREALPQGNNGA